MYNKVLKNYQINNLDTPYKIVSVFKKHIEEKHKEKHDQDGEENEDVVEAFDLEKNVEEILEEARENAKLIIAESNLEAKRILDDANKEAEGLKTQAFESAYSEGFKQSSQDAEEKYVSIIDESNKIRNEAKEEYEKILISAEKDIVNLSLAIARKVIGMEVATNSDVIISLVRDALKRTSEKDNITIKVSEDDFIVLNEKIYSILGRETGLTDVDIKQNLALENGEVIIETPFGVIDGSVEKKLANVEESFSEFIRENQEDEEKED